MNLPQQDKDGSLMTPLSLVRRQASVDQRQRANPTLGFDSAGPGLIHNFQLLIPN
jgi:hypothetical protein